MLTWFFAMLFCLIALVKSALILYYPKQFHHVSIAVLKSLDINKITGYLMVALSVLLLFFIFTGRAISVLASGWFWIPFCALFFLPMLDTTSWNDQGKASGFQKTLSQHRTIFYFLMIISALCLLHGLAVL